MTTFVFLQWRKLHYESYTAPYDINAEGQVLGAYYSAPYAGSSFPLYDGVYTPLNNHFLFAHSTGLEHLAPTILGDDLGTNWMWIKFIYNIATGNSQIIDYNGPPSGDEIIHISPL